MAWPSLGLPVAWDLVGRRPDECLLDKTATTQAGAFHRPAFLKAGVLVDAMHAVVLLVDADVLLDTATCETEASVPACLDPAALVAMVPTTMVFHRNKRDRRSTLKPRLRDNCPLIDQVYAGVVIRTFALAAAGAASCENIVGNIVGLESRGVRNRVFGQGGCFGDGDWGGTHGDECHGHKQGLL